METMMIYPDFIFRYLDQLQSMIFNISQNIIFKYLQYSIYIGVLIACLLDGNAKIN